MKNDFGLGGAWPWYWGAFYPKGGKRTKGAQLSMSIDYQYLECGFHMGDYADEQAQRFAANVSRHGSQLTKLLADTFRAGGILYGGRPTFSVDDEGRIFQASPAHWEDFLNSSKQYQTDVSVVIPAGELLRMSEEELVQRVAKIHSLLFPLVLLAVEDDPMPTIKRYLDIDEDEIVIQPIYPLTDLADDTGLPEQELATWISAIRRKGQAIFYGPPGTGKTYVAERLAKHLIGGGDGFSELVQFHPSYSYEEFIQASVPLQTRMVIYPID